MDSNQQDQLPATLTAPPTGEPVARSGDRAADHAGFPTWAEAPVSSNVRKARVRAALFRKLEVIRIGRFTLLELLGAGAMGEIYAAYDEQLDRKVALKLVRGGSEPTAKADERLLREAQTLAQVSHPNVVQIYDAGTDAGRVFIAMELIQGKTLTTWLSDAGQVPRAIRQREILRVFIAAGRGLEAAHAAGVAHRDFKPDNVLVGDDGRVRVVDFGLARALDDELGTTAPRVRDGLHSTALDGAHSGDATLAMDGAETLDGADEIPLVTGGPTLASHPESAARASASATAPKLKAAMRLTATGAVMGTPFFMAPEQMRGAIPDRRSDQFSFCVALYHALYGAFPFSGKSLAELKDAMTSDEVEFAPGVPVRGYIRRALARGLSVEPAQRFPDMGQLLSALQPRSRRRRGLIAAAGAVSLLALVVALLAGGPAPADPCAAAGTTIDAAWSADRQAAIEAGFRGGNPAVAGSTWHGFKTRVDGYAGRWRAHATDACRATHVAHTQSMQQLDRRMACLDRGRRQLTALVGELGSGAPDGAAHAIRAAEALPDPDPCNRAENLLYGLAPPPPAVAAQVAALRDQIARARALEWMARFDDSLVLARDASAKAERVGYPPVRAEAIAQVARTLEAADAPGTRAEVERTSFEALDIAEAERHDQLTTEIWNNLVTLAVWGTGDLAQAHAWWRRNAAAVRRLGDEPLEYAKLHYLLGEIYSRETKYAQAADEERLAIAAIARAPAHTVEPSRYYGALARSLDNLDRRDEATQLHERAIAIATAALGAGDPNVIKLQINYGRSLSRSGRIDRARNVLEGALATIPAGARESSADAARIHGLLSDLEYTVGRLDQAADHAHASLQVYKQQQPTDQLSLAEAHQNLANVELKRRSFSGALAMYQEALALRRRYLGDDHRQTAVTEGSIAETLVELGRYDEAMTHLAEAERIFDRGSGYDRATQAWILTVRGELLTGKRAFAAAVPVLEHALELFTHGLTDPPNEARANWMLSRALHALGTDHQRVRALAERAHALFAAQGAIEAGSRDAVARYLAQLADHHSKQITR